MERLSRVFALDEIGDVAEQLAAWAKQAVVITFQGDLGAGKTTLISAMCKVLKVRESVSSPTFSLVNTYESTTNGVKTLIHHMDFYRLSSEEEGFQAGLEEMLHSGDLCLVEWPQRAPGIIPAHALHVFLETVGPDKRRIRVLTDQND